jgi:hypothetical protein
MSFLSRISVCLLLVLAGSSALCHGSSDSPAVRQRSKAREGFMDFALKQINPQNTDYGHRWEEARKLVVDQTVKSIDSWAVLVALGFLVLSVFLLLHQLRERNRREAIAAEFLAQYHNALVDARTQMADAIQRYNQSGPNRTGEVGLGSSLPETKESQATAAVVQSDSKAGENGTGRNVGARQNRQPEVDLVAQISTLRQQLNISYEREKNLQKELIKAQRRAPAVQPRDVNIPG